MVSVSIHMWTEEHGKFCYNCCKLLSLPTPYLVKRHCLYVNREKYETIYTWKSETFRVTGWIPQTGGIFHYIVCRQIEQLFPIYWIFLKGVFYLRLLNNLHAQLFLCILFEVFMKCLIIPCKSDSMSCTYLFAHREYFTDIHMYYCYKAMSGYN